MVGLKLETCVPFVNQKNASFLQLFISKNCFEHFSTHLHHPRTTRRDHHPHRRMTMTKMLGHRASRRPPLLLRRLCHRTSAVSSASVAPKAVRRSPLCLHRRRPPFWPIWRKSDTCGWTIAVWPTVGAGDGPGKFVCVCFFLKPHYKMLCANFWLTNSGQEIWTRKTEDFLAKKFEKKNTENRRFSGPRNWKNITETRSFCQKFFCFANTTTFSSQK